MSQGSILRVSSAILASLAAVVFSSSLPANAQSVKLQFGGPLGTFTATPSGHGSAMSRPAMSRPTMSRPARSTTAKALPAERRNPHVAVAEAQPKAPVRNDAADAASAKPVTAAIEPPKAETKTEANAPTAVASGENTTCRKFIATAGTTIEVPCTSVGE